MNVLIVGVNSYIGDSFYSWVIKKNIKNLHISFLDAKKEIWKTFDYSNFDVLYYVTGIAHIKETTENKNLYYKINRDLTISIAKLAKKDGVQHFIVLSTMGVYGKISGRIKVSDIEMPTTHYGKSKYEADLVLKRMEDESFHVAIVRPPMVYGPKCKGNYNALKKISLMIPFFPKIQNERSMIYIDNLNSFIYYLAKNKSSGVFIPQNDQYVCTSTMVREIAKVNKKNVSLIPGMTLLLSHVPLQIFKKVFGSLTYEKIDYPGYKNDISDFSESIRLTEGITNE